MSELSLAISIRRAAQRLGGPRARKARADKGGSRLPPAVEQQLATLLDTQERPSMSDVARQLGELCRRRRLPAPARSTIYNAIDRVEVRQYAWGSLPSEVQQALYNATSESGADAPHHVGGDQVAFYAFNYGNPRALSFAAGLPWLCLVRASRRRGWRPKSEALLRAIMKYRGI